MGKDATSIIDSNSRTHIRSLKKHVTILFTDIVGSTKYWDKFGDIQGRLMVDRHNRLLFPLVAEFKGRIIKTIGDSIMAAFAKPEHAVEAAVAMQQTMAMERQGDETFKIQIRIGIHTGDAIVEKEDVYGDLVNVAARVESISQGDEILVSQATVAYIDDEYAFIFRKKGWFIPKGKDKKFFVYTCDWKNHPPLIDQVIQHACLPVSRRQKLGLGLNLLTTFAVLYFIYLRYLRYLLSDAENGALLYLNFSNILQNYPYITGAIALLLLISGIFLLRIHRLPLTVLRLIKGSFIFSIGFMSMYIFAHYLPIRQEFRWNQVIDSSIHHYVEILEDDSRVFLEPSLQGRELRRIHAGHLLLQTDFTHIDNLSWNKVLLGAEKFGWIVHVSPPQMGVPEKKVSESYKFYFRYKDLYTFIFAFLCFIIGCWKYRIRPI
jgi:class 3 adenylate cyclase